MIKIRITFTNDENGYQEMQEAISDIEKSNYEIIYKSRIFKGRGQSKYSSIYVETRKK